jgi:hypothetical protein
MYRLPTNLLGQLPPGHHTGTLHLGHLAHADVGEHVVKLNISYDGGSTYQGSKVIHKGNGRYDFAFTVPRRGQTDGYGAISIRVKDDNGATLTEEVIRAFAVKS